MATPIVVKQEPGTSSSNTDELAERLLKVCDTNVKGVALTSLQTELPDFTTQQITTVINQLLKAKKLSMVQRGKVHYIVRVVQTESVAASNAVKRVSGLADHDEKLVYQIVEASGNKGIWEKDVRVKSKLPLLSTTKILKNLESKKLIKSVKSVAANRKKMYMLYELEPDVSVTGGTWYSDQTFDTEFVQLITECCFVCLQKKAAAADKMQREMKLEPMAHRNSSFATSAEILQFITDLQVSKVRLSVPDIEAIMEALVYDSKVERSVVMVGAGGAGPSTTAGGSGQMKSYRAVTPLIQPTGLMRMPCGLCPVIDECHEGGIVNPSSCQYMQAWLNDKLQF